MKIRRYAPGFCEGADRSIAEFTDLDGLLAIPWVKAWSTKPGFHQFSTRMGSLLVEVDDGQRWHVIGTFRDAVPEGLPTWTPPTPGGRGPGGPGDWTRPTPGGEAR